MAKTRVHELAKQYGIESKEVLEKLKEMGEFVKSASSTIELPVEMRFKKEFGDQLKVAAEAAAPAKAEPEAPAEQAEPKPAKKAAPKAPPKQAEPEPEPEPEPRRGAAGSGGAPRRRAARGRAAGSRDALAHAQGALAGPAASGSRGCAATRQQPVLVQPGHGPPAHRAAHPRGR